MQWRLVTLCYPYTHRKKQNIPRLLCHCFSLLKVRQYKHGQSTIISELEVTEIQENKIRDAPKWMEKESPQAQALILNDILHFFGIIKSN